MKILIVEDDFISRKILSRILVPYGECDIAVDGREAVQAFEYAWKNDRPYDLICLDIIMPKVDGFNALKKIREIEEERGIEKDQGVKVIITTAIDDPKSVNEGFKKYGASSYIIKPITKDSLIDEMRKIGLFGGN